MRAPRLFEGFLTTGVAREFVRWTL